MPAHRPTFLRAHGSVSTTSPKTSAVASGLRAHLLAGNRGGQRAIPSATTFERIGQGRETRTIGWTAARKESPSITHPHNVEAILIYYEYIMV